MDMEQNATNIEYIYSKTNNDILHMVVRYENINTPREDIIPEEEFLQLAILKMPAGKTFRPHYHIPKLINYKEAIAQESWVIIKGSVEVYFYDTNNKLIHTTILKQGDVSITLKGGHNFKILEKDTIVYEFKTGPYYGVELDKEFI